MAITNCFVLVAVANFETRTETKNREICRAFFPVVAVVNLVRPVR